MLTSILANFFERDLRKLISEINAFKNEDNLWKTQGSITNSAGNLALHITGGLNFFFGTQLAHTGYTRHRDEEFSKKDVPRMELVTQLEALILLIRSTLDNITPGQLEDEFPIAFDGAGNSTNYVLLSLLGHLNYHLGQVNYLRRMME